MKYRLTQKIGSGGMAEVFRATGEGPEGFERAFVVKRILPGLSDAPEFVRMFVDEAKISARLLHPNIVQVFEFAYQDGGYYIVMEPVDGVDMGCLLRKLERRGAVAPVAFAAEVGRQACRGLGFAHGLSSPDGKPYGIVHRDVTPPNIMVAWNGAVKILDFGIARAVQELRTSQTDAGIVKGKMSYIAPEMLQGQPPDARSDLFSLGVVLHELLCGRRLFVGENDLETLKLVSEMPVPRPSSRNPEVKPAFDEVILRALARDPSKRYQSADEMSQDLERLVLRKRYAASSFAKQARALVPQTESGVEAGVPAEIVFGQRDASTVIAEGTPRVAPPPAPTPAPPAAPAFVQRLSGALRGGRASWLPSLLPTATTLVLMVIVLRHGGAASRMPAAPPPPALAPVPVAALCTTPAVPSTVQISIDSRPQGALVTLAGTPTERARPLGETPGAFRVPRGETPMTLVVSKRGFAPLSFKVVPNHDKDVDTRLERGGSASKLVASSQRHMLSANLPIGSSPSAARHLPR
ncbi:MAG TPA: serine/threonine-protein kinase [Polyangia bacterium]|nr:serine/threonine-protein kinase [Polyangia bacterium]